MAESEDEEGESPSAAADVPLVMGFSGIEAKTVFPATASSTEPPVPPSRRTAPKASPREEAHPPRDVGPAWSELGRAVFPPGSGKKPSELDVAARAAGANPPHLVAVAD